MARGLSFTITAVGTEKTARKLRLIGFRMMNMRPAFEWVEKILNSNEERVFDRLKGDYVDTGALMDSLTGANMEHALREAHANEIIFGTHLPYARFQRRKGKSAVLKLMPKERKVIDAGVLFYAAHGVVPG